MAPVQRPPVPSTPADALAALEADLPKVTEGRSLEQLGWRRPTPLTLLIPLTGQLTDGTVDEYLLKLVFNSYRTWPPSAQFVNPETLTYSFPADVAHLPKIEGSSEIAVHANYSGRGQLICASVTLEFYAYGHSVEDRHRWDGDRQNFSATLAAIRMGLGPTFYRGRQKQ